MFVLKSLGRLILGDAEKQQLVELPVGSFWGVPRGSPADQVQLGERASLSLERAGGNDRHEYKLVVLLEEEEKGREEEDDDETNSKGQPPAENPPFWSFKLSEEMHFVRDTDEEAALLFRWRGDRRVGGKYEAYEFVPAAETTLSTVQMFHMVLAQCLWESIEHRPYTEAPDSAWETLMVTAREGHGGRRRFEPTGEICFESAPARFYVFDASSGVFVPASRDEQPVRAIITPSDGGAKEQHSFDLNVVRTADSLILHRQPVDPDATLHTDRQSFSFIWCSFAGVESGGSAWTFSLRFESVLQLMELSNAMGQAIYEILNGAKVEEEDRDYFMNSFLPDTPMEDSDPSLAGGNEPYISDSEEEEQDASDDADAESSGDDPNEYSMPREGPQDEANQALAVGYKHDRSFVTRGHSMSVFKHTADDTILLHASIDKMKSSKTGRMLNPTKMMLHQEDQAMLLMDKDHPGRLFKMDLEYGKVVEDWQIHPDEATSAAAAGLTDIIPDSKYAQMTANPTLIGINARSLFRIDPRLPGAKRVDAERKEYAVKNDFTCGTTTGRGELAVASAKGEIRLFDKLDKRAKTLLPGFGDPIIGVDVTESGKYLLATCKCYLLLICTEISGDPRAALGFTKSMGAQKPAPKRLQLKPEHVAYMGGQVSFTPARFSTGQSEERSIITSTGPYVITWNLRRVKQGHLGDYQIRRYEDKVVADNFRYGQDRSIVVTLPHHVTMISKRSLSTPTVDFFRGRRGAASNVVRDYYQDQEDD